MATHEPRTGFTNPPKSSLAAQLRLLLLVSEGMQKHGKEPDYPTQLDGLGVPAAHDAAATKLTQQAAMKALARKATGEAVAERTLLGVFLDKIQAILYATYGKQNVVLWDYGFRPVTPRKRSTGKARTGRKPSAGHTATKGTAAAGTAESGSPGSTPPASTNAPATTPSTPSPSTTPRP